MPQHESPWDKAVRHSITVSKAPIDWRRQPTYQLIDQLHMYQMKSDDLSGIYSYLPYHPRFRCRESSKIQIWKFFNLLHHCGSDTLRWDENLTFEQRFHYHQLVRDVCECICMEIPKFWQRRISPNRLHIFQLLRVPSVSGHLPVLSAKGDSDQSTPSDHNRTRRWKMSLLQDEGKVLEEKYNIHVTDRFAENCLIEKGVTTPNKGKSYRAIPLKRRYAAGPYKEQGK